MKNTKRYAIAVALSLICSHSAFAADDGDIGPTSTGSSDITLTIPDMIIVTGMADITFGNWNGTAALADDEDISVAGNDDQASPTYSVTATGSGAGGAFELDRTSPASPVETLVYTVEYNDATGTTGNVALTSGTPLTAQGGIHADLATGTSNANYEVKIAQSVLNAAHAGDYSGTLTLVVAPE